MIDLNTWIGPWPFALAGPERPAALAQRLQNNGVAHAALSHLGAVFAPDPMPANRQLLATARRHAEFWPVPVINPQLGTWAEHWETCRRDPAVKAVRLLPNYHGYRLQHAGVDALLARARDERITVMICVRLADVRTQYFGLNIKGVPMTELDALLGAHPKTHFVLHGLHLPELRTLAGAHQNFSADLSFCEWDRMLPDLLTRLPARRLVLGTAAPLLSLQAGVDQLRLAPIPARARRSIGETNARRLLGS